MKQIALDTETTGADFYHNSRPYLVTMCEYGKLPIYWEWDVDPLTRIPRMLEEDILEIRDMIASADELILHNSKFDYTALTCADKRLTEKWDWDKVRDTMIAAHMLASGMPKDLYSLGIQYLNKNLEHHERAIEHATKDARNRVRKAFPDWRIAGKEFISQIDDNGELIETAIDDTPSAKDKLWKIDMWLPKAICIEWGQPEHEWTRLVADYANGDSALTAAIWPVMKSQLHYRGLEKIFEERMKLIPIAHTIEARGVTLSGKRMETKYDEFCKDIERFDSVCLSIAQSYDYDLKLPKGAGNNNSLREFVFDVMEVPVLKTGKNSEMPSLDKEVMEELPDILEAGSPAHTFITTIAKKRKYDTACSYIRSYRRYMLHVSLPNEQDSQEWYRLHPNLNPTGTAHLRWSCKNPNSQNFSKKKEANLKYVLGPLPGREWYVEDAKNIELRIPAFESGEQDLIDVFLSPKKPPYYGSYHMLVFDVLHPELFKEHGMACKDLYESTWYQWVKNGNFALIYGCQERKADITFHKEGAYRLIKHRFPKMAALSQHYIRMANKYGYVETIPDRSIDETKGYQIMCGRGDRGYISPTIPLNYHVSGTAMQWMNRAMVKCQEKLWEWNDARGIARDDYTNPNGYYIALQVHDALAFDFPKMGDPTKTQDPKKTNLGRARILAKIMETCGEYINVPTPVGIDYHDDNWESKITIA